MTDIPRNVPAIRFTPFTTPWDEFELSSIAAVLDGDRGTSYPNGDDFKQVGHTLFLSASNVTSDGFRFGDNQYINEEKSNKMGNGKLVENDIVLTSRGSVGHIAWYNKEIKLKIPFARINSGMLILRVNESVEPCIITHFLKSPLGEKKISLISFGSAQPQLTKQSVEKYSVFIPNEKSEQKQVGDYFQQFDTLITQHQQKHDKLLNLKKSLLEKMFPKQGGAVPAIRFKGFNDEWKDSRIEDICAETYGGGTPKTSKADYWDGNIPWIQSSDLIDEKVLGVNSKKSITEEGLRKSAAKLIPANSIAIVTRVGVGKLGLIQYQYSTSQDFLSLGKLKIDCWYGIYAIWRKIQSEKSAVQGTSIKGLTKEELLSKSIPLPKERKEQGAIGGLFQKVDKLLELHQQQLTKLKNLKKAHLAKMFV